MDNWNDGRFGANRFAHVVGFEAVSSLLPFFPPPFRPFQLCVEARLYFQTDDYTCRYNLVWTLYGFVPFMIRNRFGVSEPKVREFLTAVRANEAKSLPIGVAGFCWGGQHAVYLASGVEVNGKPLSDACFTAHPSSLSIPGDIKKIKKPTSIAIGDKDFVMPMSQVKETEGELKKISGVHTEIVVYPGAGHGFSVRADMGNEKQSEQAKQAEDQALNFFSEVFKSL